MMPSSILSLFGRFAGPFLVPVKTTSAAARGRGQGRPSGRRVSRLVLDAGKPGRTLVATKTTGKTARAARASVASIAALSLLASATSTIARQAESPLASAAQPVPSIAPAVSEAARRFRLPEAWIYAVMRQESGGRPDAVSLKGAMGLLQLMPATWRELTLELDLGDNPYDVRANVLAGSAYLRRMYDRFGSPGFLAAYNAGPERYARHLAGVQSLPLETRLYVQRLAPLVGEAHGQTHLETAPDPRMAGLFVVPSVSDEAADNEPAKTSQGRTLWP